MGGVGGRANLHILKQYKLSLYFILDWVHDIATQHTVCHILFAF